MEEGGYYHGFLGRGVRSLTHAHTCSTNDEEDKEEEDDEEENEVGGR